MIFGHYSAPEQPTPGCAYVARIAFEYGPHIFKPGDDFDWRTLGLVESQAVELWVAGRLLVKSADAVPPAPATPSKHQQRAQRR